MEEDKTGRHWKNLKVEEIFWGDKSRRKSRQGKRWRYKIKIWIKKKKENVNLEAGKIEDEDPVEENNTEEEKTRNKRLEGKKKTEYENLERRKRRQNKSWRF